MQIKTGTARGQPLFFDLPALLLQPSRTGHRRASGQAGVPACWGLRPPRDSTPCPRHWFGLFGLRHQGRERARRSLSDPRHQVGLSPEGGSGVGGRPPGGRGAPLPANPCSFVTGHHVFGVGWASGKLGVVLRSPQTLVPSSWGTTPLGADGLTAGWAWCSVPR